MGAALPAPAPGSNARPWQHSGVSWSGDVWTGAALDMLGSGLTAAYGGWELNQEAAGKFRHLQGSAAAEPEYGAPRLQFSTKVPKFCQNLA